MDRNKEGKKMKRTYTQTWTMSNEKLQKATVRVYIYDTDKYTEDVKDEIEVTYTGLTAWDIIEGGADAEEIESMTDESGVDEHHEYLVLHFNDGTTATFRNSHVDMHIR